MASRGERRLGVDATALWNHSGLFSFVPTYPWSPIFSVLTNTYDVYRKTCCTVTKECYTARDVVPYEYVYIDITMQCCGTKFTGGHEE